MRDANHKVPRRSPFNVTSRQMTSSQTQMRAKTKRRIQKIRRLKRVLFGLGLPAAALEHDKDCFEDDFDIRRPCQIFDIGGVDRDAVLIANIIAP